MPGVAMRFAFVRCVALVLVLLLVHSTARTQSRSPFEGMWSNAPSTPEGARCQGECSDVGLARLNALLDDPANDNRPYSALSNEATKYEVENYVVPHLTEFARKSYPMNGRNTVAVGLF